jgi:4-hydroxy-2-oxoheptanedioate aldolase
MPRYVAMGARFILSGQDGSFMMAGAQARTAFMRKVHG